MNQKQEEALRPIVEKWVTGLNGRFREHISDKCLVGVLLHQLDRSYFYKNATPSCAAAILDGSNSAAYESAVWLFEKVLEHECRAGGNGHHVAQSYDQAFLDALRKEGV